MKPVLNAAEANVAEASGSAMGFGERRLTSLKEAR
jgi:hypothetical protein